MATLDVRAWGGTPHVWDSQQTAQRANPVDLVSAGSVTVTSIININSNINSSIRSAADWAR